MHNLGALWESPEKLRKFRHFDEIIVWKIIWSNLSSNRISLCQRVCANLQEIYQGKDCKNWRNFLLIEESSKMRHLFLRILITSSDKPEFALFFSRQHPHFMKPSLAHLLQRNNCTDWICDLQSDQSVHGFSPFGL